MTAPAGDRRERLRAMLADLKMPGALEAIDDVLVQVGSGAVTAGEAIERVLGVQIALRNNRRLPAIKTLAQFDLTFQPTVKREQVERLHELGFLDRAEATWSKSAAPTRLRPAQLHPRPTGLHGAQTR